MGIKFRKIGGRVIPIIETGNIARPLAHASDKDIDVLKRTAGSIGKFRKIIAEGKNRTAGRNFRQANMMSKQAGQMVAKLLKRGKK